jgi:hypothetical protein
MRWLMETQHCTSADASHKPLTNTAGETCLVVAAREGDVEMMRYLVLRQCSVTEIPLAIAHRALHALLNAPGPLPTAPTPRPREDRTIAMGDIDSIDMPRPGDIKHDAHDAHTNHTNHTHTSHTSHTKENTSDHTAKLRARAADLARMLDRQPLPDAVVEAGQAGVATAEAELEAEVEVGGVEMEEVEAEEETEVQEMELEMEANGKESGGDMQEWSVQAATPNGEVTEMRDPDQEYEQADQGGFREPFDTEDDSPQRMSSARPSHKGSIAHKSGYIEAARRTSSMKALVPASVPLPSPIRAGSVKRLRALSEKQTPTKE